MAISKGEFALRRGVTPGRVSQWIAAGQISGAAIVGDGRFAQIDEALACQQLGVRLDTNQRHANGLGTNLKPVDQAPEISPSTVPPRPADDSLEQKLLSEKLIKAQRDNREAETDEAQRLGHLVDAAEARRAVGKEIAQLILRFDGSLTELASELASEFKLPSRDVLHKLRASWRRIRVAASIEARERGEPLPERSGFDLGET